MASSIVLYFAIIPDNVMIPSIYADKIKHATAFFTLSLLLNRASSTLQHRLRNMGALLLFGIFIEFVQYFIPTRDSDIDDIVADLTGIILFQLLFSLFKFIQKKRKKSL